MFKFRTQSDCNGKLLAVGDSVRLCRMPDLSGMSKQGLAASLPAFRWAMRHNSLVQYFEEDGLVCVILNIPFGEHRGGHAIFVESFFLRKIVGTA